jgi:hypothetical protein
VGIVGMRRRRGHSREYLTGSGSFAPHADVEIAEAIIEPLDVGQHADGRMVLSR